MPRWERPAEARVEVSRSAVRRVAVELRGLRGICARGLPGAWTGPWPRSAGGRHISGGLGQITHQIASDPPPGSATVSARVTGVTCCQCSGAGRAVATSSSGGRLVGCQVGGGSGTDSTESVSN